jgi:hypothetical protein
MLMMLTLFFIVKISLFLAVVRFEKGIEKEVETDFGEIVHDSDRGGRGIK